MVIPLFEVPYSSSVADHSLFFSLSRVETSSDLRVALSLVVDSFAYRSSCLSTQTDDVLALESGKNPFSRSLTLISHDTYEYNVCGIYLSTVIHSCYCLWK